MKKESKGFSLIETLIAIAIFAILGVMISTSLVLTIQSSKKSESLVTLRENLNYSMNVIERNLRNAGSISDCTNSDTSKITYIDQYGNNSVFSCKTASGNSYLASGSANTRLTSPFINITDCSFTCAQASLTDPATVTINISAQSATGSGSLSSQVTSTTVVYLRN